MAAGDVFVYYAFKDQLLRGAFNLASDTIKLMLVNGYTMNETALDTHNFRDDTTTEYSTAGGYTAGGVTLANKSLASVTVSSSTLSNNVKWDADDVTWTSLTLGSTPSHAIMYKSRGGASSADELLLAYELGVATNGGNYTLAFHANGILVLGQ
jgi:hypothetical protein